jgi:hypothetical protein
MNLCIKIIGIAFAVFYLADSFIQQIVLSSSQLNTKSKDAHPGVT